MVTPFVWEYDYPAVQARTAPGTFPTERGPSFPVPPAVSSALLDRLHVVGGGVRPLLQQMRQADPALYEHSLHVWALTQQLSAFLAYPDEEQTSCALAALVHDVGKLTLPRSLLDKPARLTAQEYALMQQHPAAGARLLRQVGVDEAIILLVSHHHESWDGQGYPAGLAGSAIPQGARLLAITDAFAAMAASRPYQSARSVPAAVQELERGAGTQFDPFLVPQCVVFLQATR